MVGVFPDLGLGGIALGPFPVLLELRARTGRNTARLGRRSAPRDSGSSTRCRRRPWRGSITRAGKARLAQPMRMYIPAKPLPRSPHRVRRQSFLLGCAHPIGHRQPAQALLTWRPPPNWRAAWPPSKHSPCPSAAACFACQRRAASARALPSGPRLEAVVAARCAGLAAPWLRTPATGVRCRVGFGTWSLYRAFPTPSITWSSRPRIAALHGAARRRLRCELHPVALGDHDGERALRIRADIQARRCSRRSARAISCASTRADAPLRQAVSPASSGGLVGKIDVQGRRADGAGGKTGRSRARRRLIVETSTIATGEGRPRAGRRWVQFMASHGFVVADIIGLKSAAARRRQPRSSISCSARGGPLRADRRWASG